MNQILQLADTKKKAVLLMHHQPEILDDQSQLERLGASGKITCVLSGHLHCYARRYVRKGLTVVNGMPLMPHADFIPIGFQTVELFDEGKPKTRMFVLTEDGGCRRYAF